MINELKANGRGLCKMVNRKLTEFPNCKNDENDTNANKPKSFIKKPVKVADMNQAEDEKWWNDSEIVHLDLSGNNIKVIPTYVQELSFLQTITMMHNNLHTVCLHDDEEEEEKYPFGIWGIKTLSMINFDHNELRSLDLPRINGLECYHSMKKLSFNNNKIETLTGNWLQFNNLEFLYLSYNQITSIPEFFHTMPNLLELHLDHNNIQTIPKSIVELKKIRILNLSHNNIHHMDVMVECPDLITLNLSVNRLHKCPDIRNCSNMKELFLQNNNLTDIHISFQTCNTISYLDVSNNKINNLPHEILYLQSLQTLDISNGNFRSFPYEVSLISSLQKLVIYGNQLARIPAGKAASSFDTLKKYLKTKLSETDIMNYENMFLSSTERKKRDISNHISVVEEIIRSSFDTGVLDFENKNICWSKSIGKEIYSRMCNIIENNKIHVYDDGFSRNDTLELNLNNVKLSNLLYFNNDQQETVNILPKLKKLYLNNNNQTNIILDDMPKEWFGTIEVIEISRNQLTEFSFKNMNMFISLTALDVSFNQINTIPEELYSLYTLQDINLSNNPITSLGDVSTFTFLKRLNVSNCRLNSISSSGFTLPKECNDENELELGLFYTLEYLNLENNNLRNIPCELGLYKKLNTIMMNGNCIRTMPQRIILKGTESIKKYLKEKLSVDLVDKYEGKKQSYMNNNNNNNNNNKKNSSSSLGYESTSGGYGEDINTIISQASLLQNRIDAAFDDVLSRHENNNNINREQVKDRLRYLKANKRR